MKDYVLLKPLDVTERGKKATKPIGAAVPLTDELAKWLDSCGVISLSGEVRAPAVARSVRTQAPPRKRCCGW